MIKKIRQKIYYRFLELISLSQINEENDEIKFKNCFIYYDYEREFSGHITKISDSNIYDLLMHLDQIKIKTTWFTVGKVVEKYFKTIIRIAEKGHEIGSHTYSHSSPLVMTKDTMKEDFKKFEDLKNEKKLSIEGFHSPNGLWDISMFNFLSSYKYLYDVISLPIKEQNIKPLRFTFFLIPNRIVRLVTLGDDWDLYQANKSRLEVFNYFKNLYLKTKIGDTFGIGFHPWILYSDENILMGYKDFLLYLTEQKNTKIRPAKYYVKKLNDLNKRNMKF